MMLINSFKNYILFFSLLFALCFHASAEVNGEQLFKTNCTACHTIGGGRLVGPDLIGVTNKRNTPCQKGHQ